MAHHSNTGRTDTIRSDHTPSIPIRVIPGNTELVKDTSTGAFHLNVGFHLSFNVKDLMQSLATLTNVDVNIKAESSVPISAQTVQQPPVQMEKDPPQKKNDEKREHFPGFGGPLKKIDQSEKIVDDSITWETKLYKLTPAAQEYRERNAYQKSTATFMRPKAKDDSATEESPPSNGEGTASKGNTETNQETMQKETVQDDSKAKSQEAMQKEMGQECNTQ